MFFCSWNRGSFSHKVAGTFLRLIDAHWWQESRPRGTRTRAQRARFLKSKLLSSHARFSWHSSDCGSLPTHTNPSFVPRSWTIRSCTMQPSFRIWKSESSAILSSYCGMINSRIPALIQRVQALPVRTAVLSDAAGLPGTRTPTTGTLESLLFYGIPASQHPWNRHIC